MANIKSAKKANRVSERRRKFNELKLAKIKQSRRALVKLLGIPDSKKEDLQSARSSYFSALDKAAKTGYISKNKSSRLKSRSDVKIASFLEIQKNS